MRPPTIPRAGAVHSRGDPWGGPVVALLLLFALPARAIDLQQLAECVSPSPYVFCWWGEPMLSPDGKCVAFTDSMGWPPYYEWWPSIAVLRLSEGGSCGTFEPVASGNNWHTSPAWSPDGSRLAFVSTGHDAENSGIWTIDVKDPMVPPWNLTHVAASVWLTDPAWSTDAQFIACSGEGGIYVVPSTGGDPVLVAADASAPSWGPDGRMAFVRGGDLWVRESDGRERALTLSAETEGDPSWSPQGAWIAFGSNRAGNWDIWVIAASGGTPVQVTSGAANEQHPSWSALADRIVCASTLGGHFSIWMATNLPDWTTPVASRTWSDFKRRYR